jgi:hypothetical protein
VCCEDVMRVNEGRRTTPSNNLTIVLVHVEVTSRSSTLRSVDDGRL